MDHWTKNIFIKTNFLKYQQYNTVNNNIDYFDLTWINLKFAFYILINGSLIIPVMYFMEICYYFLINYINLNAF